MTSIATAGMNFAFRGVALAPVNTTATRVDDLTATTGNEGVILAWQTGQETDLVGFHVYGEFDGQRLRVTEKLLTNSGPQLGLGARYTFVDAEIDPAQAGQAQYWLEAVATDGSSTWHGPIAVVAP
jgi:hypothetical protein